MWKSYGSIVRRYPKVLLSEERRLILEAQKGSKKSKVDYIFCYWFNDILNIADTEKENKDT